MYTQRWNKYGAKKTVFNGRRFDSKLESGVAAELELRKKAGEFVDIDYQFPIKLYCYLPNGDKAYLFKYICDFRCHYPNDGTFLLVEAKGYATEVYRTKRKLLDLVWLPDHPEYSFEEIRSSRY